ncbi:MAG: hypothetical protein AUH72_07955 [Acidobacteria bacterium 13_1_40CM_4_65_8]|nr:MAG: hypothetical protein AUH72_07955 [Acidobacteria bacterium 13_1_40CM_4_65_8]
MSARRLLLSFAVAAALIGAACGDPPDKEIQQAQGAIDAARAAGADQYATAEFTAAQEALKRANDAVEQRDYRLALNHALDARERAQNAAKEAADRKTTARSEAERALLDAMTALNDAHTKLRAAETARAPVKTVVTARRVITDGEDTVQKARAAFDGGDYLTAKTTMVGTTERLKATAHELRSEELRVRTPG